MKNDLSSLFEGCKLGIMIGIMFSIWCLEAKLNIIISLLQK